MDVEPGRSPHSSAAGISVCRVLPLAGQADLAIVYRRASRWRASEWSIRALASGQVKKDRELTTTGPYAYVRNPLYLGSILLGDWIRDRGSRSLDCAGARFSISFSSMCPSSAPNKSICAANFPAYAEYMRSVPSLLPRTLWFGGVTDGFSRELYFRHREYNALLGAAAMLAVLIAKILWLPG